MCATTRWVALARLAGDGRLEIDNDAVERALRTVALGRKNYLFAGADSGGERAAVLYTLIGTAKINGFDLEGYLRAVLARLVDDRDRSSHQPPLGRSRRGGDIAQPDRADRRPRRDSHRPLRQGAPCAAMALVDDSMIAGIRRRPSETLLQLLERLDATMARTDHTEAGYTDATNES